MNIPTNLTETIINANANKNRKIKRERKGRLTHKRCLKFDKDGIYNHG